MKNIISETQDDARVTALFQAAFPAPAPSEALTERIAALAAVPNTKRHFSFLSRRRVWQGAFVMACIVLLTIGLSVVRPQSAMQSYAQRVENAVADAHTTHTKDWILREGKPVLNCEIWVDKPKERLVSRNLDGKIFLIQDGKMHQYDKRSNSVGITRMTGKIRDFTFHSKEGMAARLKDLKEITATTAIIRGRKVRVFVQSPQPNETIAPKIKGQLRWVCYIDASLDRPLRINWQRRSGNAKWETYRWQESEYDVPIPDSLFEKPYPEDATVQFDETKPLAK